MIEPGSGWVDDGVVGTVLVGVGSVVVGVVETGVGVGVDGEAGSVFMQPAPMSTKAKAAVAKRVFINDSGYGMNLPNTSIVLLFGKRVKRAQHLERHREDDGIGLVARNVVDGVQGAQMERARA